MSSYQLPSQLAFFQETTQGTPPADAAAWASGAVRVRHISEDLDVSPVVQAVVEDSRSQTRAFALNQKVLGLKNVDGVSYSLYATGTGATTADDTQVAEIDLATILEHCLGGMHRGYTSGITTVTNQTTFVLDTGNGTNFTPGQYVAVRDATTGICEPVRVLTVSTDTITIDKEPHFTVVADDTIEACITLYVDQEVLQNSNGSGGPFTFSYLIQKGLAGTLENFELKGCKTSLDSMELSRGELVKLGFTIMAASFDDGSNAPSPTWSGSPSGNAPIVVGPDTVCHFQTEGTATANLIDITEMSVDFGLPVERIATITENLDNMEGTAAYMTTPSDTMAELTLVPYYGNNFLTAFQAQTLKTMRWMKLADRGKGFAVAFHKCEIAENPARGTNESYSTTALKLRAHEDDDNASASNTDMWKSKVVLVLY